MNRDLQSVQPYRRPIRRFFRRFFRRGGDGRALVEEEMDRDLKRIQPYNTMSSDDDDEDDDDDKEQNIFRSSDHDDRD